MAKNLGFAYLPLGIASALQGIGSGSEKLPEPSVTVRRSLQRHACSSELSKRIPSRFDLRESPGDAASGLWPAEVPAEEPVQTHGRIRNFGSLLS